MLNFGGFVYLVESVAQMGFFYSVFRNQEFGSQPGFFLTNDALNYAGK